MRENVFLNGKFTDFSQAWISVNDRGFLFGDGVYEFISCYYGKTFQLEEHLVRLERSAAELEILVPYTREEMISFAQELLYRSGLQKASGLYMQITRGAAPRIHHFPESIEPTVLMTVRELPAIPEKIYSEGVSVIIVPDERWARCYIKTVNLVPNVLAKEKAVRAGAFEAVLNHPQLGITEASSSNVFAVKNKEIITAPAEGRILGGITRATVLDFARDQGLVVSERYMKAEEFLQADEAFFTNTWHGVVPIREAGEATIGDGSPGPVSTMLRKSLQELIGKLNV